MTKIQKIFKEYWLPIIILIIWISGFFYFLINGQKLEADKSFLINFYAGMCVTLLGTLIGAFFAFYVIDKHYKDQKERQWKNFEIITCQHLYENLFNIIDSLKDIHKKEHIQVLEIEGKFCSATVTCGCKIIKPDTMDSYLPKGHFEIFYSQIIQILKSSNRDELYPLLYNEIICSYIEIKNFLYETRKILIPRIIDKSNDQDLKEKVVELDKAISLFEKNFDNLQKSKEIIKKEKNVHIFETEKNLEIMKLKY